MPSIAAFIFREPSSGDFFYKCAANFFSKLSVVDLKNKITSYANRQIKKWTLT
jgi:hypothetical protein